MRFWLKLEFGFANVYNVCQFGLVDVAGKAVGANDSSFMEHIQATPATGFHVGENEDLPDRDDQGVPGYQWPESFDTALNRAYSTVRSGRPGAHLRLAAMADLKTTPLWYHYGLMHNQIVRAVAAVGSVGLGSGEESALMSRRGVRGVTDVQRDLDELNRKAEQEDADIKRAEEALRLAKEARERTGRSIIEKNLEARRKMAAGAATEHARQKAKDRIGRVRTQMEKVLESSSAEDVEDFFEKYFEEFNESDF